VAEVLANVFKESGVTEAEIKENQANLKRLARRIGTTQLEASTISGYHGRLTKAKDDIMVSLTFHHQSL